MKQYFWEDPILYGHYADQMIRRCISEEEIGAILQHCHSLECGGHFGGHKTMAKVLQSKFYCQRYLKMLMNL